LLGEGCPSIKFLPRALDGLIVAKTDQNLDRAGRVRKLLNLSHYPISILAMAHPVARVRQVFIVADAIAHLGKLASPIMFLSQDLG